MLRGQIAHWQSKQRRMAFILWHLIEYCCPGQHFLHSQKTNKKQEQEREEEKEKERERD